MNYGYFPNYVMQSNATPQHEDRIWVQDEQGANAYLVAPNSFVRLWSASEPVFYEKRSDASGRPLPIDKYKYERVTNEIRNETPTVVKDYDEIINALEARIKALEDNKKKKSEDLKNE